MDNLTLPYCYNFEIRAIFAYIDFEIRAIFAYIDFEIRAIKYYLCTC